MELLEKLDKLQLDDYNKYFLEDTNEIYENFIKQISQLDEKMQKYFLETIKNNEMLNNQQAEKENSFLISVYMNMKKPNSINEIIKILKKKDKLSKNDLKYLHHILMIGTNSELNSENFRSTDTKFVGTFNQDGTKNIDYMPIPSDTIEDTVADFLNYYNNKNIDNIFLNPFISHGILSVMQPFDDGNTRLSRLIQHAKMWQITNDLYSKDFALPTLYLSKNYLLTRAQYRGLITKLAREKDNEAWNQWIKYNLNMANEQLFYLDNNLKKLIKQHC